MKPFSEDGRPQDWFSQKNCALQYNSLLSKVETPRRKRGEKTAESETPGEAIVKKLTTERIKELRKIIEAEAAELLQLDEECKMLSDENISDEKLQEIEASIEREEKEAQEKKAAHEKFLSEREEKKQAILAALKAHSSKLPLKGAAAAAVQQAGAARRASTQSERSSFSDVDSPLPTNQASAVITAAPENDSVKKEDESETVEPADTPSSPMKSPTAQGDANETAEPMEVADKTETEDTTPKEPTEEPIEATETIKEEKSEEDSNVTEVKTEVEETADSTAESKETTEVTTEETETEAMTNEDDEDDEVIIKKEVDIEDSSDGKKTRTNTPKPARSKKISELSEDDDTIEEMGSKTPSRGRGDARRSKKISERSDEAEESPGPPSSTSRATRRSRKIDTSNDGSNERSEDGSGVENKRLSRVKETDVVAGRGRRGSGATNTTSRSSSPVASGDESEADQTPSRRTRKKSGRGASNAAEVDSAPTSPSPSSVDVSEDTSTTSSAPLDEWKKCALNVVNELRSHKLADRVFAILQTNADNEGGDVKPVVLRQTDINAIRKNVENNVFKNNSDLHHALHHLFLNLIMSLGSHTEVFSLLSLFSTS